MDTIWFGMKLAFGLVAGLFSLMLAFYAIVGLGVLLKYLLKLYDRMIGIK